MRRSVSKLAFSLGVEVELALVCVRQFVNADSKGKPPILEHCASRIQEGKYRIR